MKQVFSFLLAITLLLSAIPLGVLAETDAGALGESLRQSTTTPARSPQTRMVEIEPNPLEGFKQKELVLTYDSPAPDSNSGWENWSLPVGNGYQGANIFGGVKKERLQLSEESLWTGGPIDTDSGGVASYPENNFVGTLGPTNTAVKAEDFYTARELGLGQNNVAIGAHMAATILSTSRKALGNYQNFSEVYLDFKHDGSETVDFADTASYQRNLDINQSLAGVEYEHNGITYTRELLASYPDHVLAMKISASEAGKISFTLRPTIPHKATTGSGGHYSLEDYGKIGTVEAVDNNTIELQGNLRQNGLEFAAQFKVLNDGGTLSHANDSSSDNGTITIENANSVVLLISFGTNYVNDYDALYRNTEGAMAPVSENMEASLAKGYEDIKSEHIADYQELFDRVVFDIGGQKPLVTTDKMLAKYKSTKDVIELEELYFQYGRYLLISSSRAGSLPANLQGLWNVHEVPPWQSDYHFNINLQMNYWPAVNTNLFETAIPLVEYVDSIRKPGREAAKMFGVTSEAGEENGWAIMISNNPFGFVGMTNPLGRTAPGFATWSPGSTAWISQNLYDYYQYSGDAEYLESTIYPVIREAASFFKEIIIYDPASDRMVISPSYSSEHGPMLAGTTFEQELIWQLLKDTIEAAEILGLDTGRDAAFIDELRTLQEALNPLTINTQTGRIREWYQEEETWFESYGIDRSHRHISHLVGLYPGNHIVPEETELMEAAEATLNYRGDGGTGWSRAHKINLWARLQDGNRAYSLYQGLLTSGTLPNLWDTHAPFQIDGNFGGTAGMAEMLVQGNAGYISPLPALPDAWATGRVKGLTTENAFVVDLAWSNKELNFMNVTSRKGNDCVIKYSGITGAVVTDSNGNVLSFDADEATHTISFPTTSGDTYEIKLTANYELEKLLGTVSKLYPSTYTAESYAALMSAVQEAEDYLAGTSSLTLAQVILLLKEAIFNLDPNTEAIGGEIGGIIDFAEKLLGNQGAYSPESVTALEDALANALVVARDPSSTTAQLIQSGADLEAAINGLGTVVATNVPDNASGLRYYNANGSLSTPSGGANNTNWYYYPGSKYSDGQIAVHRQANSSFEFDFTGNRIEFITERAQAGFAFKVDIDSVEVASGIEIRETGNGTVDFVAFDSATLSTPLTNGAHTIKVTCTGPATGHADIRFKLDGFRVYGDQVPAPDKSALLEAIKDASSAKRGDYTTEDWENLKLTEKSVGAIIADPAATPSAIADAAAKVNGAVAKKTGLNFADLDNTMGQSGAILDFYAPSEIATGYAELKTLLETAKQFRKTAATGTTQLEIDNLLTDLKAHIAALVAFADLDFTELDTAINQTESFFGAVLEESVESGYEALTNALQQAKTVRLSALSQGVIDSAAATLTSALDGIVLINLDLNNTRVLIEKLLENFSADNKTTAIQLEQLIAKVLSAGQLATVSNFVLTPATTKNTGSITATVTLREGAGRSTVVDSIEFDVSLVIKVLKEEVIPPVDPPVDPPVTPPVDPPVVDPPVDPPVTPPVDPPVVDPPVGPPVTPPLIVVEPSGRRSSGGTSTPDRSSNLPQNKAVAESLSSQDAKASFDNAVLELSPEATKIVVKFSGNAKVTDSVISELQKLATEKGLPLQILLDTIEKNIVVTRITITAPLTAQEISTTIALINAKLNSDKSIAEKYGNSAIVADFAQPTNFGGTVRIHIKLPTELLGKPLEFYRYNPTTKLYALEAITYAVDANGYLSFETHSAENLIICAKQI